MTSTIAAVASAPGAGLRAAIRVSGPRARAIVTSACRRGDRPLELVERAAVEATFVDDEGGLSVLILWMPGPRSFTAEDVAEIHLPGHPDLVQDALERLFALGAEPAQPGEFTRRAFENGRIDLTRAEGVLSLVSARSEEERRAAAALLAGGLARRIEDVRDALESIRALAEASLDFDESDTGHVPIEAIVAGAEGARAKVDGALGWERSRVARAGVGRVVLAGAPNAGKSTLFNRLASGAVQDAAGDALVSDLAGTTRDGKRAEWDLGE
ncbi:MAG: GTPase, partial [Planctomycetota bacterium]